MFAKYSIRAKIAAVVALLLMAMAGMGLLAVRNMRAINARTLNIHTGCCRSVGVLGDLRTDATAYRSVIRLHLLAETAEAKAAAEKRLETFSQGIDKARQAYEKLITSAEERALYNEWSQEWSFYGKGVQQVLALSRDSVGKSPHDAHELNESKVLPISKKSDDILDKDIDLNNKGADAAAREAADNYASGFVLLATILGAAIVLGAAVGIYLVRDVSRGIASIVKPMQALGSGDLTAQVPHQGEKTEIGAMADSLQVFKQALIAKKAANEAAALDADRKSTRL